MIHYSYTCMSEIVILPLVILLAQSPGPKNKQNSGLNSIGGAGYFREADGVLSADVFS